MGKLKKSGTVLSIEHFDELVLNVKKQKGIVNINCFLMPDAIENLTKNKKLIYEYINSGIVFLSEEELYFELYIFADPKCDFEISNREKPIIVNFPYSSKKSKKYTLVCETLIEMGFKLQAVTKRMQLTFDSLEQIEGKYIKKFQQQAYKIVYAESKHLDDILYIWEHCFDPLINILPSKKQLLEAILQKYVLCAVIEDKVVGVLQMEYAKGLAYIWHEAVHPDYRGLGIGSALSAKYLEATLELGISKHMLWVVETEQSAINFHISFGYQFDGKISEQYVLF